MGDGSLVEGRGGGFADMVEMRVRREGDGAVSGLRQEGG